MGGDEHRLPWEWIELQMIELYHCSHETLAEMDAARCLLDLEMRAVAAQLRALHAE